MTEGKNAVKEEKTSFVGQTRAELSKVTWPTKPDLLKKTGIVLGVVIFSAIFVWIIDTIWSAGVGLLLK